MQQSYEPPVLAEIGGFAAQTRGSRVFSWPEGSYAYRSV
jgi:hypothetical protein